ncbi:peptidoglycan/xylan/chitin deacetylase (PgdA/CDA1 family) [Paenibacillus anaericanus]|uniref:polysaccharide deacetylase family protein n=1 Tax=Paenibacillus anaericanus TaxID=170367 RepID=UPI0027841DB2|nr:polysaccharide deacetylase family protein [Paenibacillus anaericanus]MDQ0091506.1 peptidoglycan/xylan/chitin deacetylase (PgdA/CDA1 family) [Paenibacillus anaericanus]
MSRIIVVSLTLFIIIYMFIPYLITRIWGLGVTMRGRSTRQVAFTFDDGPDPLHTPKLLDVLKRQGVKGTFFVLGSKAEQNPELTRRIHQEGHQIGIHNYTHLPNWIMSPRHIRKQHVQRSADIIERITGERPTFYRPPWGILNMGDLFSLRKSYRIVLWSVMGGDWKVQSRAQPLKEKLMKRIKPGSIILLHDSGDTWGAEEEAPYLMIEGLEEVLEDIQMKGYQCLRTDELLMQES